MEGHGDRLAGLTDVGRARGDGERALAEAHAQGSVLLRQQADATDDLAELGGRQTQLVLHRLGQQLAVVRKLPVDQARGQHHIAELEHDLVLSDAHRQRLERRLLGDPH